jgi:hypothetical protein
MAYAMHRAEMEALNPWTFIISSWRDMRWDSVPADFIEEAILPTWSDNSFNILANRVLPPSVWRASPPFDTHLRSLDSISSRGAFRISLT